MQSPLVGIGMQIMPAKGIYHAGKGHFMRRHGRQARQASACDQSNVRLSERETGAHHSSQSLL